MKKKFKTFAQEILKSFFLMFIKKQSDKNNSYRLINTAAFSLRFDYFSGP